MKCPYYEENFELHLTGNANLIAYLTEGFSDWQLFGFVKDEDEIIGLKIDEQFIVPVYGNRYCPNLQSDDSKEKEQDQIDNGKTAILLFYGIDNCSWMRRITSEEFDCLKITRFSQKPQDLFYNS